MVWFLLWGGGGEGVKMGRIYVKQNGGQIPFSKYMSCSPGTKMFIYYLEKEYRIKISRMSPNKIFMFLINPLAEMLKYKN